MNWRIESLAAKTQSSVLPLSLFYCALQLLPQLLLCSASTFQQSIKQISRMARSQPPPSQRVMFKIQRVNQNLGTGFPILPLLLLPLPSSPAYTADAASLSSTFCLHLFLSVVLPLDLQWLSKALLLPFSSFYLLSNLQPLNLRPASSADGIMRSLSNHLGGSSWASQCNDECADVPHNAFRCTFVL